jgi:TolB-like protein
LDLARGCLRGTGGVEIALRHKSFELLRVLVQNAGRTMGKDILLDAVWPNVHVTEDSLVHCVRDIRRALGDTNGALVRTVSRRGYLFDAEVLHETANRPGTEPRARHPEFPLPDKPSLVVLPFQNMSGDPEQAYFADGMVEDITTALSRIRSLFVIARNSAFTYKGRAVDIRQVGRELGVRYVLEGSVRRAGSRVRITGQLNDAATATHLWADRFDGTLDDVFALQDQVTSRVVAAIEPTLRAAEIRLAQRKPTENLHAYDMMLRALPHIHAFTRDGVAEARRLLGRAIEVDPNYAPAVANLATCHWLAVSQGWIDRADPAVAEMMHLCGTALTLGRDDPLVLYIASELTALPGGDLNGGIALINKSISLNPNSAAALQMAGRLYAYAGDKHSALVHLERSARLNPHDRKAPLYFGYALAHFVAGEHEASVEWTGKALRDLPHHMASLRYRAASLGLLGRYQEGRQVVRQIHELVPEFTIARARRHIEFDMHNVFRAPEIAASFYEGLRQSGVPE